MEKITVEGLEEKEITCSLCGGKVSYDRVNDQLVCLCCSNIYGNVVSHAMLLEECCPKCGSEGIWPILFSKDGNIITVGVCQNCSETFLIDIDGINSSETLYPEDFKPAGVKKHCSSAIYEYYCRETFEGCEAKIIKVKGVSSDGRHNEELERKIYIPVEECLEICICPICARRMCACNEINPYTLKAESIMEDRNHK